MSVIQIGWKSLYIVKYHFLQLACPSVWKGMCLYWPGVRKLRLRWNTTSRSEESLPARLRFSGDEQEHNVKLWKCFLYHHNYNTILTTRWDDLPSSGFLPFSLRTGSWTQPEVNGSWCLAGFTKKVPPPATQWSVHPCRTNRAHGLPQTIIWAFGLSDKKLKAKNDSNSSWTTWTVGKSTPGNPD